MVAVAGISGVAHVDIGIAMPVGSFGVWLLRWCGAGLEGVG